MPREHSSISVHRELVIRVFVLFSFLMLYFISLFLCNLFFFFSFLFRILLKKEVLLYFCISLYWFSFYSWVVFFFIPSQFTPFPMNPLLHEQKKEPSVLRHVASSLQLSIESSHSFTSKKRKRNEKENVTIRNFLKKKTILLNFYYL